VKRRSASRPIGRPTVRRFLLPEPLARARRRQWRFLSFVFFALLAGSGCAQHHAVARRLPLPPSVPSASIPPPVEGEPPAPGEWLEEGLASWYGVPFNGRRTSNGEIYDMYQFTAAHRTLPFNSVVRVTNLNNGKRTEVRITDRGPFVANRIIDVSLSAAQALDLVGPGTAPVRLEMVGGPNPTAGFFTVQVGAFQVQENAERLREYLSARYAPIVIQTLDSPKGPFYRVRVGRVPSEDAAQQLAEQLHNTEQLTTFVVRLDE
jgi:rare lipoprotein A